MAHVCQDRTPALFVPAEIWRKHIGADFSLDSHGWAWMNHAGELGRLRCVSKEFNALLSDHRLLGQSAEGAHDAWYDSIWTARNVFASGVPDPRFSNLDYLNGSINSDRIGDVGDNPPRAVILLETALFRDREDLFCCLWMLPGLLTRENLALRTRLYDAAVCRDRPWAQTLIRPRLPQLDIIRMIVYRAARCMEQGVATGVVDQAQVMLILSDMAPTFERTSLEAFWRAWFNDRRPPLPSVQ